jgi:hypothetical protein
MLRIILFLAALVCLSISPVMAQDDALLTPNRLSVGGGALVGVNSYYTPLLSVMYSRTFAQGLDVELSFQNGASSRFSSTDLTHTVVNSNYNSLGFVNLSTLDATCGHHQLHDMVFVLDWDQHCRIANLVLSPRFKVPLVQTRLIPCFACIRLHRINIVKDGFWVET